MLIKALLVILAAITIWTDGRQHKIYNKVLLPYFLVAVLIQPIIGFGGGRSRVHVSLVTLSLRGNRGRRCQVAGGVWYTFGTKFNYYGVFLWGYSRGSSRLV